MKEKLPWQRILAEGFAITFSILLALAIDSWWEGRQLAQAEADFLTDLRAEFAENRAELVRMLENERFRRDRLAVVVREAGPDREGLASDSIRRLVEITTFRLGFYPRTDALERGTAGAGLEVVRDPFLRRRISGFWDTFTYFFRNQARYTDLRSTPSVIFGTGALVLREIPQIEGVGETEYWTTPLTPDQANALKFFAHALFLSELAINQGESVLGAIDEMIEELGGS